jgi:hypothetical protein
MQAVENLLERPASKNNPLNFQKLIEAERVLKSICKLKVSTLLFSMQSDY